MSSLVSSSVEPAPRPDQAAFDQWFEKTAAEIKKENEAKSNPTQAELQAQLEAKIHEAMHTALPCPSKVTQNQ